jgi:hypothetical protein
MDLPDPLSSMPPDGLSEKTGSPSSPTSSASTCGRRFDYDMVERHAGYIFDTRARCHGEAVERL